MKFISKELTIYFLYWNNFFFFFVISITHGWGIFKLQYNIILNRLQHIQIFLIKKKYKSYTSFLKLIFFGFYQNYLQHFQIKGMGFKTIRLGFNLIFKLGYSHRILYYCQQNLYLFYRNRQIITVESRSLFFIKSFSMLLRNLRKINNYKKKGIFCKGFIIKNKISSKKAKV